MKIAVCSDLHLEFAPLTIENPGDVKVLILSGDILVENDLDEYNLPQIDSGFARHKSTMYHTFFEECCEAFEYVIYVAGNHEHYHGDFKYTASELKKKLAHYNNLHVLDREVFEMNDVVFVGSTFARLLRARSSLPKVILGATLGASVQLYNPEFNSNCPQFFSSCSLFLT